MDMNEPLKDDIRMSFLLPSDIHQHFIDTIPWGVRSHFLRRLIEIALARIGKGGNEVIGAIIAGDYDPLMRGEGDGKTT